MIHNKERRQQNVGALIYIQIDFNGVIRRDSPCGCP